MSRRPAWSRPTIARQVAHDLPDGAIVNLGIGMPTQVGEHLPADREILLHSENGVLGMGPPATGAAIDPDLINASRTPVTLLAGASITDHVMSFTLMRGGRLSHAILGAFEVSERGDLANWMTDAPDAIAAVGGAMDLAVGAASVWVMMEHVTRDGRPRILRSCRYPLTGQGVVDRIYTDLAVIDVDAQGLRVTRMVEGISPEALQAITEATLRFDPALRVIAADADGR